MQTLYKRDTTGKIRTWAIETRFGGFRTHTGVLEGAIVTSAWTDVEAKNVGRSNEVSVEHQAHLEAQALTVKKLERGYTIDLAEVDNQKFRSPMLAKKYDGVKLRFPVYSQPKLDGIRCVTNADGMWTRTGKPILGADHVFEALAPFFDRWPTIEFDGELYNHELHDDFNEIVSMVRKNVTTPQSRDLTQYHVYDLISAANIPFGERSRMLKHYLLETLAPMIQLVQTNLIANHNQLDALYESYVSRGYEGQMIRLDQPYEFKRSKTLLKRKQFMDHEFEITGIEEGKGNWAGCARKVLCQTEVGVDFKADIACTMAQAKVILDTTDEFIGKETTVIFFGYTPAGKPRFGKAKTLHKEQRI